MTAYSSIAFAPLLPLPVLVGLAALCLLALGFALWRRTRALWWRGLAMALLLLALANPTLVEERRQPLQDIAVVVVDDSPSQGIGPRPERTREAVAALERALAGHADLDSRIVRVGGRRGDAGLLPDGTRLIDGMREALSDVPRERLAGVVLVTDGQVHDLDDLERANPGAPVHLLLTGDRNERDRRLVIDQAPRYGIVGETQSLTLRVEDYGAGNGGTARVTIMQDGAGGVVRQVPIGRQQEIPFELRHGGPTVVEIEVEGTEGELSTVNNRTVVIVNGVRDRLRVLLVSGEPHAGERTWRNLLKADPSVDLVHFTILRPPEKQDGTPIRELSLISFPTRELFQAKLHEFDLVIFDRYRRRGVLPDIYLRNVANYVQEGGAVLTAAGPAFATPLSLYRTPLSQVLPSRPTGEVMVEGFRPRLSTIGERHPVTAELPGAEQDPPAWGRWFRQIDVEDPRGNTLMEGLGNRPVLILERVGEGRVAQLLSDHAWLWARGFEGGGPQAELLRRVAHWLMKEPDLEEEDLRASAEGGRLRIQRRSLSEEVKEVEVTAPGGQVTRVPLNEEGGGRAGALMAVDRPGLYRLSDGRRTTVAAVGDLNPREYSDLRTTDSVLGPLVELTGGGTFWLGEDLPGVRRVRPERDAHGPSWLGLVANEDYLLVGVHRLALLPAAAALVLLLGAMMLAWHREGR